MAAAAAGVAGGEEGTCPEGRAAGKAAGPAGSESSPDQEHSMAKAAGECWPAGPGDHSGWTFLPRAVDDRRPPHETQALQALK